jgi:hypothetical protein
MNMQQQIQQQRMLQQQQQTRQALMAQQAAFQQNMGVVNGMPMAMAMNHMNPAQLAAIRQAGMRPVRVPATSDSLTALLIDIRSMPEHILKRR